MRHLVVIGLLLSAGLSAVLVVVVPRWQVLPGPVVVDPHFVTLAAGATPAAGDPAAWRRVGAGLVEPVDGGVRLVNTDPDAIVGLDQLIAIPPGVQAFRVTATVALRGVVPGPEHWQKPRVVVRGVPADRRADIGGRYQLVDRGGDLGPVRLSSVFPVTSPNGEARLMLRLFKATGEMEIRDLVVEAAVRPVARDVVRWGLTAVWLAIGAALGLALWWRSENRLAASLVLGGLAGLALMVLLPQALRQPLHDLLAAAAGGRRFAIVLPLLHVVGFAVLALASRLALPGRPLWAFVGLWLAAAVLLEAAEIVIGQFDAGDLVDMVWNASGAALGLALAGLIRRRQRDRVAAPDPASLAPASRRP